MVYGSIYNDQKFNMKKVIIIVVILIIVGAAGYLGRHKIKSMLGMTPAVSPAMSVKNDSKTTSTNAMAPSDNIYLVKTEATKGQYITDFQGSTLYVYDKDTKGVSNCTGDCLTAWPVYTSGATAEKVLPANISVITRTDGSKQFAWKDMPLYYFAKDTKAGDITGDGVGGVWHIVKP